jgi:group I intron endonuclease
MLKEIKHDNQYLQNAWNLHGREYFSFEIIEIVLDRTDLLKREQYWMDITNCYERAYGYNISPTSGSTLGLKHSKEARRNNSLAKRGVFASISVSKASAIKQKLSEGYGIAEISNLLNVPYDTVTSIRKGRTFTYVDPLFLIN